MARGIVQSKPFIKPKAQSSVSTSKMAGFSRGKKLKNAEFFTLIFQKYLLAGIIVLVWLFLFFFLLRGTVYNQSYQITTIDYPQSTRNDYENTELFVLTSKLLRGKFYSALQVGGVGGILEQIQKEYPFVKALHIKHTDPQTVSVEYEYAEPAFLVQLGEKRFGVWTGGKTEELNPTWNLGKDKFVIDTPNYLSGTHSLSGFFYEVDFNRYQYAIPQIQETFPQMERFVYLAGSPNFIVFENKKMIYLHKENLSHQLEKYQRLKQYFANFANVYEIDLGSLLENKVVIRE